MQSAASIYSTCQKIGHRVNFILDLSFKPDRVILILFATVIVYLGFNTIFEAMAIAILYFFQAWLENNWFMT